MLDAYVVGHGITELAAALELAEVGLRVRIAAPAQASAPAAAEASAAGPSPEAPDRGEPDDDGAIRALLAHLAAPIGTKPGEERAANTAVHTAAGLAAITCPPGRTLLRGANGQWAPLPEVNVWGIPAVPMSGEAAALLGGRGALRASVDRVRPVLTIGKTVGLGALVRSRMGQQVLDRVVNTLVGARYGVPADNVDVAIAAPGLNGALTSAGSLSGAVLTEAESYVARETLVRPAVGWAGLRAALLERLALYNVQFGAAATTVTELAVDAEAPNQHMTPHWQVREDTGEVFDVVALAAGRDGSRETPAALQSIELGLHAVPGAVIWRPQLTAVVPEASVPEHVLTAVAALEAAAGEGHGRGSTPHTVSIGTAAIEPLAVGAGWSVRYEEAGAGHWRVTAAGPAQIAADALNTADTPRALSADALAQVHAEVPALAGARAAWVLAPWATVTERDAAEAALAAERSDREWLLHAGRELHAGNLADSIADARQAAVHLRRRLVGISD
ncbi:hypothetical protein JOF28_001894 [Leucobacter exalbidus]|uniref:Uncharacterized protein n=1 Tax=Leucobacter exalbidus TaxID=662960 RepID=A0A940PMH7_9MICO|nr:hypothetical protein [Leucobacter exalbidus]MBP1326662.1 hypothetical protein [Leucobacter exalbidus]